jgi:plastocyanin
VRRSRLGKSLFDAARLVGLALILGGCAPGGDPGGSAGVEVTVTTAPGETLAFEPPGLAVPAGAPVRLTFHNGSAVAHNLVFTTGITAATSTIVEPGSSEQLAVGPLADGTYRFVCTIHEEMTGQLVAGD